MAASRIDRDRSHRIVAIFDGGAITLAHHDRTARADDIGLRRREIGVELLKRAGVDDHDARIGLDIGRAEVGTRHDMAYSPRRRAGEGAYLLKLGAPALT